MTKHKYAYKQNYEQSTELVHTDHTKTFKK